MAIEILNNYINTQRKPAFCGATKTINIINNSPVSDVFIKEVEQGLESPIDSKVEKNIHRAQGLNIGIAENITHIDSSIKTESIITGTTVKLGFSPEHNYSNWICLFENPQIKNRPNVTNTVRHELGHQTHEMFEKLIGSDLTETKSFTEAYLKDKNILASCDKYDLIRKYFKNNLMALFSYNYYVEGNGARSAKCETFAEIFAMLNGGSGAEAQHKGFDKLYKKVFPNTVAYVEKLLYLLGKR